MAEKAKKIKKEAAKESTSIVVNQLIVRPVNRNQKDIDSWRNAHKIAEQSIHPNRVNLYDVYSDIELDGHLSGIWQKRIAQIRNKKLRFESKGKKIDEMDKLIRSLRFRSMIRKIMESLSHGLSGFEFIPGNEFYWKEIPRKHIKPHIRKISIEQIGEEGISYDGVWNIWVIESEDSLGFLLKCAPYALWKKGDMADWSQYVEIFGQPVIITKYDAHDAKTKMELTQVMDEAGSSLRLMIPNQAGFEMMDGKTSNANGDLQSKLKDACNQEMSVIVLGATETTTSSSSSGYAQSKEHSKQQDEIIKDDMDFVLNMLNDEKFIAILASYGYPVTGGEFIFEKETDLIALNQRKGIDLSISAKVPIDDDYWYETYAIPKPVNYDELNKKMEEERQAALSPAGGGGEAGGGKPAGGGSANPPKPNPEGGGKKQKLDDQAADNSWWHRFRQSLADFFFPAPTD